MENTVYISGRNQAKQLIARPGQCEPKQSPWTRSVHSSDIRQRIYDHQNCTYKSSFTAKYKSWKLIYHNFFDSIEEAIDEEKRIKGGSRQKKINLVNNMNLQWKDLKQDVQE
jgi:putative endonuclease